MLIYFNASHLTQGKSQNLYKALHNTVPVSSLTLSSTPLPSSYSVAATVAPVISGPDQEHCHLQAFSPTAPSSLDVVQPDIDMVPSFTSWSLLTEAFTSIPLWSYLPFLDLFFSIIILTI